MGAESPPDALKKTPLQALHRSLGAKKVAFAGYDMPVHYPAGILKEHLHTREAAGLFDVSHMGQAFLDGDATRALEQISPADIAGLKDGQSRYALLLNDKGGIKDDFMVSRLSGERALFLVVNAGTKDGDFSYIAERSSGLASLMPQPDRALLALQGPAAEAVLSQHAEGVSALGFMRLVRLSVAGVPAIVGRSGYTGEDGFEISLRSQDAEHVARVLLGDSRVLPIGLGARDSLRLEAGLCLYGHDIDEGRSPIAAGLGWVIGKRRKLARDFPGADRLMAELLEGTRQKRVGLHLSGKVPAREGAEIVNAVGAVVGHVTSGGFGPSVGAPIAMGYVDTEFGQDGTEIAILVRDVRREAAIVPMPFVAHRYKRNMGN